MKKHVSKLLWLLMATSLAVGCSSAPSKPAQADAPQGDTVQEGGSTTETPSEGLDKNIEATLTLAIWDNVSNDLYEEMDIEGRFQEYYPNVTIEIEKLKDDSEYWNAMKIRASADQLPDLMFNKTFTLSRFKDYLYDLNDTEAAANNMVAEGYAIDSKIYGIPEKQGGEYVFYWKDMFDEVGIEVPDTWDEFVDAGIKLQEYYGKDNPNFMGIAIGAKDEWPNYPFTEFMPAAVSGDGFMWNSMAEMDEPFAEGTPFNTTYQKINQLFTSNAFGKDPLGIGNDQAVALFAQKNAGMMAIGSWALTDMKEGADSLEGLETFYLPARDSESDPFRYVTQGDSFLSVTKHSENPELAKAFLEFYFSEDWYPDYINAIPDEPTVKGVTKEKDPVLQTADVYMPEKELVMYDGGGDDFNALVSATKFDYKKLGAEMFVPGFDLNKKLDELNKAWKEARTSLGIK